MTDRGVALPSVRFVGGHYDQPALFDFSCRVVRMNPGEIVLEPLDRRFSRIVLRSRYVGKAIGSAEDDHTTQICTYQFEDDSHSGMARWSAGEDGRVIVGAGDY